MFLKARTNNKASTVFTLFLKAVESLDSLRENVDVAWHMFEKGFDKHPLSAESYMTPVQLWVLGLNQSANVSIWGWSMSMHMGLILKAPCNLQGTMVKL